MWKGFYEVTHHEGEGEGRDEVLREGPRWEAPWRLEVKDGRYSCNLERERGRVNRGGLWERVRGSNQI